MAKSTKRELERYDGKPVRSASLLVAGVNSAIAAAMEADPQLFHSGDHLVLVLDVEVGSIRYDPREDGTAWGRVHNSTAKIGTFMPGRDARQLLAEQAEKNQAARDERAGTPTLSPQEKLQADHLAGLHKRRRPDCELCPPAAPPKAKGAKKAGAARR